MTDTYAGQTFTDDIEEDVDSASARLDREADAILQKDGPHARPLRRAVREDAGLVRDWGQERAARLRGSVEAEPVKATLYALGLGVVIGLLISR